MSQVERLQILKMVEKGQITAQEGARLLNALAAGEDERDSGSPARPSLFHVRVTDLHTGRRQVDIRIPLSLVAVGHRLGARFVPEGSDIDIPGLLLRIEREGLQGKVVDWTDENHDEQIEIMVE